MTNHYDYIDIDPANPPKLPCENAYHCNVPEENQPDEYYNETLIAVIEYKGDYRFVSQDFTIWKCCKLRIEKKREPDDTIKRLWWYDFNGSPVLSSVAFVESEIQSRIKGVTKYASGPEVPPAESWRTV